MNILVIDGQGGGCGKQIISAIKKDKTIQGMIGIVIANSMLGEITAEAAAAVANSSAVRLLFPMNQCDNIVIGVQDASLKVTIPALMEALHRLCVQDC